MTCEGLRCLLYDEETVGRNRSLISLERYSRLVSLHHLITYGFSVVAKLAWLNTSGAVERKTMMTKSVPDREGVLIAGREEG